MPFIRGRYHINPIAGAALEAAREADERLAALQAEHSNGVETARQQSGAPHRAAAEGPIRRVEIETAEMVPSPSGRAQQGFVARIHRAGGVVPRTPPGEDKSSARASTGSATQQGSSSTHGVNTAAAAQAPETHVFSDHQDLADFLRRELANGYGQ